MWERLVTSCSVFLEEIRWLFEARPALVLCQKKSRCRERSEATGETNGGQAIDGGSRWSEVKGVRLLGNAMD